VLSASVLAGLLAGVLSYLASPNVPAAILVGLGRRDRVTVGSHDDRPDLTDVVSMGSRMPCRSLGFADEIRVGRVYISTSGFHAAASKVEHSDIC
jgi:hypothetical protein